MNCQTEIKVQDLKFNQIRHTGEEKSSIYLAGFIQLA